jgi:hypothetical protein
LAKQKAQKEEGEKAKKEERRIKRRASAVLRQSTTTNEPTPSSFFLLPYPFVRLPLSSGPLIHHLHSPDFGWRGGGEEDSNIKVKIYPKFTIIRLGQR